MGHLLSRFSISIQVGCIGAIALTGFALVGLLYLYGSSERSSAEARVAQVNEIEQLMNHTLIGLLELRRNEKDFFLRRDEKYTKQHADHATAVAQDIETLRTELNSAEDQGRVQAVRDGYDGYIAQFKVVADAYRTLGLTQEDGLRGQLRRAAHELEGKFAAGQELALQVSLLTLRRHEKDFIEREDVKYVASSQKEAATLASLLKTAKMPAEVLSQIQERLATYQQTFAQLADVTVRRKTETEKISSIFHDLQPKIDEMRDILLKRAAAIRSAAAESENSIAWTLSIGILLIASLTVAFALVTGRHIAQPIQAITGAMRELAAGDKSIQIPARGRADEVGAMASALQVFKDTAIEADRMAAEQKAEQEKRLKRGEFIAKLVADFNDAIKSVVEGVSAGSSQMRSSAQALSAIAEETNNQSTTVAAAAEEASRSVQTVASAAEELNASIAEINRQIDGSARLANGAVDQVKTTNKTVETLSSAAKEIGNVVQLIQDIAAQTNLLALNATIEAARAGEAGKGFAVVASEVKSLANQTAKATEDISAQIAQIQTVANQSVAAMAEVGKSVGQISEASSTVASAAQEQAAATSEISRSVQQVSVGTTEVASNIVHVTKAAGETGQMSAQVLSASNELSKQAENLRKIVTQFIAQVQAA